MIAGLITNGYLLTAERIQRLNRAGLEHLQISIDNVMPDEVSKKSLKVLDRKLQLLAEHADFHVNINSVVGGGIRTSAGRAGDRPARDRAGIHFHHRHHSRWRRASCSRLGGEEREVYTAMRAMEKCSYAQINYFQDNIAHGKENDWRCRAGARYLYICEDGLVHYCSQQRGYPGQAADGIYARRTSAANTARKKPALRAAPWPACIRFRIIDFWRAPQTISAAAMPQADDRLVQIR